MDSPEWLDYEAAARYLGRDYHWLRKKADKREIAYYVVGKHRVFLRVDLDAYLASRRRPALAAGGGPSAC